MRRSPHQDAPAFSIILAIGLSLIFTLIGLFVMEYIIPFSRSTSSIENATIAQYQAFSGVEESLRHISQNNPGFSTGSLIGLGEFRGVSYEVTGSGSQIPRPGTGTQPGSGNGLDPDWNRLSQTEPIQLLVGNNRITSLQLRLRVPNFGGSTQSIDGGTDPLVLWQLSSSSSTLIASNSGSNRGMIRYGNIPSNSGILTRNLFTRNGNPIDNNTVTTAFGTFYSSNCGAGSECVLRISLINKLTQGTTELPYLEYQINTGTRNIPYQITDVSSTGISYGFSRVYNVRVPQATTSAAFDFTVFQ